MHTKPVAEDESPKPSPDKSPPGKKGKQRPTTTTTTKWLSKSGNKKVKTEPENEAEPNKKKEEATAAAPAPDIFTCNSCGAKACVPCDRPWHENESCAEYQARIKDRLAEEDATLATMERSTKKCPRCEKRIEKNGGCAHMYCKFSLPPSFSRSVGSEFRGDTSLQVLTNFCQALGAIRSFAGTVCGSSGKMVDTATAVGFQARMAEAGGCDAVSLFWS